MYQRNRDIINPVVLTLLSFYTRYRIIGRARKVIWDEVGSNHAYSTECCIFSDCSLFHVLQAHFGKVRYN
jgi:dolichyl-phosphate-mannose--protein O-mannosyl transferase